MDSFISIGAWTSHQSDESQQTKRPFGHFRSLSSITKSPSPSRPARTPGKSTSTSELPRVPMPDSLTASPALKPTLAQCPSPDEDGELSTLPDPRSRAMSPVDDGMPAAQDPPDLNDEVTALSTKLINAINHQTNLDNTLSSTRHELEQARERIRQLEAQNATQQEMLVGDVWVRRATIEHEKKALLTRISNEKKARAEVETEKRKIELELENLTQALFEEANKMVVVAKEEAQRQQDALHKKNDQLKAQIADTEALLRSQQEQLAELKQVMEQMTLERDDQTNVTAPSSPGFSKFEAKDDDGAASEGQLASPLTDPISPTYPTSFSHLIQPVLRTDLSSYEDFKSLARVSRNRASSRVSPIHISGVLGLGLGGGANSSAHPSNGSTSSLSTPGTASPQTPNTPASTLANPTGPSGGAGPSLKDTKFFKRVLAEDIEPTLRLDASPGLSWLARRSVLNAMIEGSLVVEPVPANSDATAVPSQQLHHCSLCGELRKESPYLRTHRFRTSESDSAQRHPLCNYCLGRVRSTGDFLGFLRILKDGHWRSDDADEERAAWEESVRLREHMFWSRIGGGVVPAAHGHHFVEAGGKDPQTSQDGRDPVAENGETQPVDTKGGPEQPEQAVGVGDVVDTTTTPAQSVRNSTQSLEVKANTASENEKGTTKRLSITIPPSGDTTSSA